MGQLSDNVKSLLSEVEEAGDSAKQESIAKLKGCSKRLWKAANQISDSWSGSYLGYHSELYYEDFQKPPLDRRFSVEWGGTHGIPPGWKAHEHEEVKEQIEQLAQTSFDFVEQETAKIVEDSKALKDKLLVELSPLHNLSGLEREKQLLQKIENIKWEESATKYAHAQLPGQLGSRDSEAFAQGAKYPAHLVCEADAFSYATRCDAIGRFLSTSKRLLQQLNLQLDYASEKTDKSETDALTSVNTICRRFHLVVQQLQHRQRDRDPFQVRDEYDVQDLLHSLLHVVFDDIRPEEYTPSYGGKASRMDFLLKRESIVVEAKMTRAGLAGPEVFNELALDVTHYKAHPDCRVLVCFVYDPEHRITNPKGVEHDLRNLSTERLEVIPVITP